MNWIRGSVYHLTNDKFNISRVNCGRDGKKRRYELWDKTSKECLASELATDDEDAERAVKFLKSIAESHG